MQIVLKSTVIGSLLAVICLPLCAWESEKPVALPIPVSNAGRKVHLEATQLNINENNINIKYTISDKSLRHLKFSVYIPPFSWSGVASDYPDRHIPELKIAQDGSPLKIKSRSIALINGLDITKSVINSGLRPERVGLAEEALLQLKPPVTKNTKQLISDGALEVVKGVAYPKWQLQVFYSWELDLTSLAKTSMTINYRARPGYFPIQQNSPLVELYLSEHCATLEKFNQYFNERKTDNDNYYLFYVYKIPFGFTPINSKNINLNFTPEENPKESDSASFTCLDSDSLTGTTGAPNLNNLNINNSDGVVSILFVKRQ